MLSLSNSLALQGVLQVIGAASIVLGLTWEGGAPKQASHLAILTPAKLVHHMSCWQVDGLVADFAILCTDIQQFDSTASANSNTGRCWAVHHVLQHVQWPVGVNLPADLLAADTRNNCNRE